ncbi:Nif3-like dinuclear metal center hexameric protein [Campylobacter sp.]|uniref:Nif3-like dinuclear metal center hexameric protein n=1 Tax=Campylobacter sp. TaxID=205 RepID=UPI002703A1B7|nr:Nif3-like dinuclear metal center hexameric protein [Campylobacter sp.]
MKIAEIYKFLNELSPFETQEGWDNSGLIIGSPHDEVSQIYLSLDIDFELLNEVKPNSLIITHHPLIFKGLKSINSSLYPSSLITRMIKKDISLISLHTNYDLSHLNEYVASEILGFKEYKKDEFLLYADVDFSFDELCEFVKEKFYLKTIRVARAQETSSSDKIRRIALCTGSGGDLISKVKADVFISGDFKYHQALEARINGLNLIDIGHFETERYFGASLAKYLQNFPIATIITNSKNPFTYC